MSDVLLVGETNPFGGDPVFALYHEPRYSSGNQLRLILGMSDDEYEALDKMNLCVGRWSVRAARVKWAQVVPRPLIVLLGQKVRAGADGPAPFVTERRGPSLLLGLPHPSGLNRVWHEPGTRKQARDAFVAARRATRTPMGRTAGNQEQAQWFEQLTGPIPAAETAPTERKGP